MMGRRAVIIFGVALFAPSIHTGKAALSPAVLIDGYSHDGASKRFLRNHAQKTRQLFLTTTFAAHRGSAHQCTVKSLAFAG